MSIERFKGQPTKQPHSDVEPQLLTIPELARRLRVKTSWVYSHATDLGALRVGKYLRFEWSRVLERLY